jgi:hypothetical protein
VPDIGDQIRAAACVKLDRIRVDRFAMWISLSEFRFAGCEALAALLLPAGA